MARVRKAPALSDNVARVPGAVSRTGRMRRSARARKEPELNCEEKRLLWAVAWTWWRICLARVWKAPTLTGQRIGLARVRKAPDSAAMPLHGICRRWFWRVAFALWCA